MAVRKKDDTPELRLSPTAIVTDPGDGPLSKSAKQGSDGKPSMLHLIDEPTVAGVEGKDEPWERASWAIGCVLLGPAAGALVVAAASAHLSHWGSK